VVLVHLDPATRALDLPAVLADLYAGPVSVARDGDLYRVPEAPAAPAPPERNGA
jgi:hypothetical protein